MTTVFFDRRDVAARPPELAAPPLCLTPSAFMAAEEAGLDPVSTLALFRDRDHARCVAAGARAVREFDAAARECDLPPEIAVAGRQAAWYVANISQRLVRTIREYPAWLRNPHGEWVAAGSPSAMLAVLLPRILEFGLAHRLPGGRPPLPAVYDRLVAASARRARGRHRWLMTAAKLKLGFGRTFEQEGLKLAQIELATGSTRDYLDLLQSVRGRSSRFRIAPLSPRHPQVQTACRDLLAIGDRFSSEIQREAWALYAPYLHRIVPGMMALRQQGARLAAALDARGVASYEANGWASAALLEAARATGREAIVVNHNCHSLTGCAIGDSVVSMLYRQRKNTESTTAVAHWWPGDADIGRPACTVQRQVACDVAPLAPRPPNPRFKVLHAANYQNWSDFFPWVSETADEFVRGIRILAEAAAGIPDLDLVIRVRPKAEVDADVIRRTIVAAPNVSVCTTDDDFLDQLAGSDLLVSYFSTTVAQALQIGRPVLLWGSTQRFLQLPARTEPPQKGDRAAVYAVRRADDLRTMLMALRDHHRLPLTGDEVAAFRFGPDATELHAAARALVPDAFRSRP